jgi:hypothetical protein
MSTLADLHLMRLSLSDAIRSATREAARAAEVVETLANKVAEKEAEIQRLGKEIAYLLKRAEAAELDLARAEEWQRLQVEKERA